MATGSFANIGNLSWEPSATYQTIQTMIQNEVSQGLWANEDHIDGWCCVQASPVQGLENSWVTYTYQLLADATQTVTVIWPAGWPAPAENINGELPHHFFSGQASQTSGSGTKAGAVGVTVEVFYEIYVSPGVQPGYKPAGDCL